MKGVNKGKLTDHTPGVIKELSADNLTGGILASSTQGRVVLGGHVEAPQDLLAARSVAHGTTLAIDTKGMPQIRPPAGHGMVCFTFDDCHIEQRAVLNYMAKLHMRATIFAHYTNFPTNDSGYNVGHPNNMDLTDLLAMQRKGHEIGNHSKNHLDMTALSASDRAISIDKVTTDFEGAGIDTPVSFAYPYGYRNAFTDRDLATRFRIYRYAGTMQFAQVDADGFFRVGGVRILGDSETPSGLGDVRISDVKSMIQLAAARPVIVCFFNHLGPDNTDEATVDEMTDLMDFTHDLGVPAVTMREAFAGFNMAPNPSFEEDTTYASGWPMELSSGPGPPTATLGTGKTPYVGGEGTQVLKLTTANVADIVYKGFRIAVEPGERYWVSCRAKILNGPAAPGASDYAADTFGRSSTDTWGTASGGGAWTRQTGTAADFDVASGVGTIVSHAGETHYATHPMDGDHAEVDITVGYTDSASPSGGNLEHSVFMKWSSTTSYYRLAFIAGAFGYGEVHGFYRDGGVETRMADTGEVWNDTNGDITNNSTKYFPNVPTNGTDKRWIRVQCVDEFPAAGTTTIRAKWWLNSDEDEPDSWQYVYTTTHLNTTAGKIGLGNVAGALGANITTSWDDLAVNKPQGITGNGLRLKVFILGSNVSTLPDNYYDSPVESPYLDYNTTEWVQLAMQVPIEIPIIGTAMEVRAHLEGIVADAYIDHVVVGNERSQPDGPLG